MATTPAGLTQTLSDMGIPLQIPVLHLLEIKILLRDIIILPLSEITTRHLITMLRHSDIIIRLQDIILPHLDIQTKARQAALRHSDGQIPLQAYTLLPLDMLIMPQIRTLRHSDLAIPPRGIIQPLSVPA